MAPVSLDKINKVYENGFHAVKDLSVDIADGEFMVLVGPSGCGKTTALRMVAGLEDITSGVLRIDGKEANDETPKQRDIAMVFQNYALYPHMTVAENIGFALKLRKLPKDQLRAKVSEAAEILGLTDWLDRKPGQVSGGPRERGGEARRRAVRRAVVLPDGRAAVQPRREAAGADAGRGAADPAADRRLHHLRHARPGRGDDDGRPGHRAARRRAAAGGHPAGALRQPGQHL